MNSIIIRVICTCRSSSDPYAGNEAIHEGFRASPGPFRTFPGALGEVEGDTQRSTSPPPWFIAEPHTPRVKQDFLVSIRVHIYIYIVHVHTKML